MRANFQLLRRAPLHSLHPAFAHIVTLHAQFREVGAKTNGRIWTRNFAIMSRICKSKVPAAADMWNPGARTISQKYLRKLVERSAI